jgi:uncharacterized protein (UPF0548 family)
LAEVPGRYASDRAAAPSYPEVGATRTAALAGTESVSATGLPAGYHVLHRRVRVGHGDATFAAARSVVLGWGMQRAAGATVYPPDTAPELDLTVLVTTWIGPVPITAPCRVVWTVDDAEHAGFGYGTLPGHPERGEEAFLVSRDAAGEVWATILAFSRPATWYARLGGPVGRLVQRWITRGYLSAFQNL